MKAARHAGERREETRRPEWRRQSWRTLAFRSAHSFTTLGTGPGPPNEPPGPTISAFVDALVPPSPIRPAETPPKPSCAKVADQRLRRRLLGCQSRPARGAAWLGDHRLCPRTRRHQSKPARSADPSGAVSSTASPKAAWCEPAGNFSCTSRVNRYCRSAAAGCAAPSVRGRRAGRHRRQAPEPFLLDDRGLASTACWKMPSYPATRPLAAWISACASARRPISA
jgi:hypothetical protein